MFLRRAGAARRVRLLGGVLALAGMQAASAGLMTTGATLSDFRFDGVRIDYTPVRRPLDVGADSGFRLSGGDSEPSADTGGMGTGFLYLTGSVEDTGEFDRGFRVLSGTLSVQAAATPALLGGVLQSMQVDEARGGFDFLLRDGSVTGDRAQEYGRSGLYVSVTGVDNWPKVFQQLSAPAKGGPILLVQGGDIATPLPGTIFLLLAGVPILLRCR